ncbi:hypothetical protein ACE103_42770 [Bradyrhizobium sp. ma5]|uniref:hypothetical protein n=1 Tax=Bradyrhizobium sp. ma5 TaxID=3344828 RepID=UPI0035D42F91
MGLHIMTQVHYFPRYSQRENFDTNNTLLLLHRLYDYNRFRFERLLSVLLRDAVTENSSLVGLGLQIRQQVGTGLGVIDGYLYQDSFRIGIETKRSSNSFGIEQLNRHLAGFDQASGGFLFLLSPERPQMSGPQWEALRTTATDRNVILVPVTFGDMIAAARSCLNDYDEGMHALVTDYEDFCSEEDLLPVDRWTLFVPPCGRSHNINVVNQLYFCPAAWSRRKARFLGIYYEKAVRNIGLITKVVQCEINNSGVVNETVSLTADEQRRILDAARMAQDEQGWDLTKDHQFFLCSGMSETMFRKSSPGGIMGHRYFDLREHLPVPMPDDLADIADGLTEQSW